jgi:mannose-6-phosphate isomerase
VTLLATKMVAKPWGRETLPAPFISPAGEKIGEVWFEPVAELDRLLVKYLFTSEKLSIQNHPGGPLGKEECWLVIAAEPGATLGVGFREPVSPQAMRAAALDGSIEDLLVWHPVEAGDFFYIPAGTVHAIGAGVSLIEVQQNNDVTYRLYDYGRPRELHLDAGLAVSLGEPHDPELKGNVPARGTLALVDGPWFRLDQVDGPPDAKIAARYAGPLLVIPREGMARVAGQIVRPGQCAAAHSLTEVEVDGVSLIAQPC